MLSILTSIEETGEARKVKAVLETLESEEAFSEHNLDPFFLTVLFQTFTIENFQRYAEYRKYHSNKKCPANCQLLPFYWNLMRKNRE